MKKINKLVYYAVFGGVLGFVGGFFGFRLKLRNISFAFIEDFWTAYGAILQLLLMIVMIVLLIELAYSYRKIRQFVNAHQDIEILEPKVYWSLNCTIIRMFVSLFLLPLAIFFDGYGDQTLYLVSTALLFVVIDAIGLSSIKQHIAWLKTWDPSKKGMVESIRFNLDWFNSSDEAEQFQTYQAGYFAYFWISYILQGAWFVFFIIFLFFQIGLSVLMTISVINLCLTVLYAIQAKKLQH